MTQLSCHTPFNPLARTSRPGIVLPATAKIINSWEVDEIALLFKTAVAAITIQPEKENALDFLKGSVYDKHPENYPAWNMLYDLFCKIRGLAGSAHAFRYLLVNVEMLRVSNGGKDGILRFKLDQMCDFLADRAREELERYETSPKDAIRPADTYRAYGLALRYATEEIGNFAARDMLARLMMASPLPVDELENPDWIDPYTGELDGDYEYLKVKEVGAVSSDGNTPMLVADLMEGFTGSAYGFNQQGDLVATTITNQPISPEEFKNGFGMSVDEYWLQFKEAQRSGYSEVTEPEEEAEGAEYDVLEKDFQFSQDLKPDTDEVAKIHSLIQFQMDPIRQFINRAAATAKKLWANRDPFDFEQHHRSFLKFPAVKHLFRKLTDLACISHKRTISFRAAPVINHSRLSLQPFTAPTHKQIMKRFFSVSTKPVHSFSPRDLMAVLLPIQNSFGIWENDLYQIFIPGDDGYTLAHWFTINGEEFLEGMVNKETVDYGDKQVNKEIGNRFIFQSEPSLPELDELVWLTVSTQQELYRNGEERRIAWMEKQGLKYKQDAKWHPAFVNAEVQSAILGDGGSNSSQAAGWDAWREAIDPDANQVFKFERRHGAKHGAAMAKFWEVVKRNKNRIAGVSSNGLRLRSGRVVDWGIALLKLKSNEIPLTVAEMDKLLDLLLRQKWGSDKVRAFLSESIKKEMMTLSPA